MQSNALTPEAYIQGLPEDRKVIIESLRKAILKNLPVGFSEEMSYGMLGYVVPHSLYPKGYHSNPKLPLPFMNVASQKNHIAVYHMGLSDNRLLSWFKAEWPSYSGKKLDMGKGCIRFRKPEDVPVELIGKLASKLAPREWIELYEKAYGKK
jgi:hypothetical protein